MFKLSWIEFPYEDLEHTSIGYEKYLKVKIKIAKSMLQLVRKLKKQNWGKIQYIEKHNKHQKTIWLKVDTDQIAHRIIKIEEVKYKYKDMEFFSLNDIDDFEVIEP